MGGGAGECHHQRSSGQASSCRAGLSVHVAGAGHLQLSPHSGTSTCRPPALPATQAQGHAAQLPCHRITAPHHPLHQHKAHHSASTQHAPCTTAAPHLLLHLTVPLPDDLLNVLALEDRGQRGRSSASCCGCRRGGSCCCACCCGRCACCWRGRCCCGCCWGGCWQAEGEAGRGAGCCCTAGSCRHGQDRVVRVWPAVAVREKAALIWQPMEA